MGRKHAGAGEYHYLYFACLVFFLMVGCATVEETKSISKEKGYLLYSRELLARGDFKGSMNRIQGILSQPHKGTYTDEAIFHAGLIYAHQKNPDKDYKMARRYFAEIIEEHPERAEAREREKYLKSGIGREFLDDLLDP